MKKFNPGKPFNDLPLLPPKVDVETKVVLRKTISAGRALAELKGLGETIPNQALLVNSLVLQEAKASSEIENIITTNDALFKAFTAKTKQVDPATKEVLRYREALWEGYQALKKRPVLSTNLFITIVQTIKKNQAGIRSTPGTTISNSATGEVIYTPPEGEAVIREKLKNLEDFIHAEDDLDPLIKLALIHYQFEVIHPFSDGNGRTGRIINILFLILHDLLELPVLYLSKAIIDRKNDYYRLLRQVTEKEKWEPWVLYMLEAVEETAVFTRERILAIRELMAETMEKARKDLPKRVYSKELIELLFRQPYTKIAYLVDSGIASRNIASSYLLELTKAGILRNEKVGNEHIFLNTRLYDLLSKQ
jgi:Fic family protein